LMTETVYVVTFGCDPPPFIFIRLYIVFPWLCPFYLYSIKDIICLKDLAYVLRSFHPHGLGLWSEYNVIVNVCYCLPVCYIWIVIFLQCNFEDSHPYPTNRLIIGEPTLALFIAYTYKQY
jgi:hypothetical protein